MAKYTKRTLSKQEKEEIRALLGGPRTSHEVAELYKCHVQQITGIWNSLRNNLGHHLRPTAPDPSTAASLVGPEIMTVEESPAAEIPVAQPGAPEILPLENPVDEAQTPAEPPPSQEAVNPDPLPPPQPEAMLMTQTRQPVSKPATALPQPTTQDPQWFGFNIISQTPAVSGSPVSPLANMPRFQIDRVIPSDGYLGTQVGNFDPHMLGTIYGGGLYRITIQVPGRPVAFSEEKIAEGVYGPPKFPKATPSSREDERDGRGVEGIRRPYGSDPAGAHPGYRPGYDPYYYGPRPGVPGPGEQATTEAIKQMGTLQQSVLSEISKARQSGPESFIANFLQNQNVESQRIRDEERKREEDRRREEREREEGRGREERAREDKRREDETRRREEDKKDREEQWAREKEAERVRHDREMERLRVEQQLSKDRSEADRKALLETEEQKRKTLELELKCRQDAFLAQMDADRKKLEGETKLREETLKAELSRNQKTLEQMQKSVGQEIRDADQRRQTEYSLRKENLEIQQKMFMEKLELEKQIATSHTTEGVVRGLQTILTEVGKRIESLIELKKMELGYKNPPGNVTDIPSTPKSPKPEGPQNAEAGSQETPEASQPEEPKDMDELISQHLKDPDIRQVLTEWVTHVSKGIPPSAFASFFVEAMSADDLPALRRATKGLDMFMRTKDWPEMLKTLEPHLTAAEKEVMKTEAAAEYYDGFRELVAEEVDAYWAAVAQRRQMRVQAAAAAASAPK